MVLFVPEHEHVDIMRKTFYSAYRGHHGNLWTGTRILQSGFYWYTMFKDAV
jgi:hypothetical protein